MAGAAGWRGYPSSLEGRRGERRGHWSRGAATRRSLIGESRREPARAALVSRHRAALLPSFRVPEHSALAQRRAGWGSCSLCSVYGCPWLPAIVLTAAWEV